MPQRLLIAKELAEIFKLVSHPDRIRIIEELAKTECDVNGLAEMLNLPGTRVSQHLAKLRAHRFVDERRDGRHHFYHLTQPEIARWIVNGLDFVEGRLHSVSPSAIRSARESWTVTQEEEQSV